MMKHLLSLLILCTILLPAGAAETTYTRTYDINAGSVTIDAAGTYLITGTGAKTTNTIKVNASGQTVNITIQSIHIEADFSVGSLFEIIEGAVNLTLSGTNILRVTGDGEDGKDKAALHISENQSLTITKESDGASLTVDMGNVWASAIGVNYEEFTSLNFYGDLTINGGAITAIIPAYVPAISGSNITINGGYIVGDVKESNFDGRALQSSNKIKITGGTVIGKYGDYPGYIDGGVPTIIIGGSVWASMDNVYSNFQDESNNKVVMKEVEASSTGVKVTGLDGASGYATDDMYADENGKVYVWLPEGSEAPTITTSVDPSSSNLTVTKNGTVWNDYAHEYTIINKETSAALSRIIGGKVYCYDLEDKTYTFFDGVLISRTDITVSGGAATVGYLSATFDTQGGSAAPEEQVFFPGAKVNRPVDPTREFYVFKDWTTEAGKAEKVWDFNTVPTGGTSLYALWVANKIALKGDVSREIKGTYGAAISEYKLSTLIDDSDNSGAKTYSVKEGSVLPAGLTLSVDKITGTPTTACTDKKVTVAITAVNGETADVELTFNIARVTPTLTLNGKTAYYTGEYIRIEAIPGNVLSADQEAFLKAVQYTYVLQPGNAPAPKAETANKGVIEVGEYKVTAVYPESDNYSSASSFEATLTINAYTPDAGIKTTVEATEGDNSWYTGEIKFNAPAGHQVCLLEAEPLVSDPVVSAAGLLRSGKATLAWGDHFTWTNDGEFSISYLLKSTAADATQGAVCTDRQAITVKLDKSAPVISAPQGSGKTISVTVTDNISGIASVECKLDNLVQVISGLNAGDKSYVLNLQSEYGNHTLYLKVTDRAGLVAEQTVTVKLEESQPETPSIPDTPSTTYTVILPQVEGAVTDPVAGSYEIESWSDFHFTLTLDEEYSQSVPVVATDRGETIEPRSSDGTYIIKQVRQPIAITITGIVKNPDPVANGQVAADATQVWTSGAVLHIHLPSPEAVAIYTFTGRLYKAYSTLSDDTALWLPQGNYIVVTGGERFKVQVGR